MSKSIPVGAVAWLVLCAPSLGLAQWNTGMVHGGGDIWYRRLQLTVTNTGSENTLPGTPVAIAVGQGNFNLQGTRAEELRLVDTAGKEYLFFLSAPGGGYERRQGVVQNGDIFEFGVRALAPGESLSLFLYFDNPAAFEPDEFWPRFQNGGFETPNEWGWRPEGWTVHGADATHSAIWLEEGGHSGRHCVYHKVGPGSERTWVQWQQSGIKLMPGRRYTVTAWVKSSGLSAGDVAGWYIHTYDSQGNMRVNQVQSAPSTGDWQPVTLSFDSQPQDVTLTIGTVLYATSGEAWFDDVELSVSGSGPALSLVVGNTETLVLTRRLGSDAWAPPPIGNFIARAEIIVYNTDANADASTRLVAMDLSPAVYAIRQYAKGPLPPYRVVVVDAARAETLASVWLGNKLVFSFQPEPLSIHRVFVYFTAETQNTADLFSEYATLVRNRSLNSLINPDIEDDAEPMPGWTADTMGSALIECARDSIGPVGPACLRLTVKPGAPAGWPGFRQLGITCAPDTDYFFAAAVKTTALTNRHTVYGHFISPGTPEGFVGFATDGFIAEDADWQIYSSTVHSPADCAGAEIHLTMDSAHMSGNAWYDGILFGRTMRAELGPISWAPELGTGFHGWPENPLVKIFPFSLSGANADSEIRAAAAGNEWEALQLGLRCERETPVTITASKLIGPGGAELPPIALFSVGYVPLDLPTSYYFSYGDWWLRPVPQGPQLTDGWKGDWPDPLLPAAAGQNFLSFTLPAQRTQAVWLLVEVPPETPAGDYLGSVTISHADGGVSFPLRFHVWNFTLPERPSIQIIYELGTQLWNPQVGFNLEDVLKQYRFLKKYRISPGDIIPPPGFEYLTGQGVRMEAADFLAAARVAFDEVKMSAAFTPWIFYALGWAWPLRQFLGLEPRTPAYEEAFSSAFAQFVHLLEEHGWREYFTYYISDEPHYDQPQVIADLRYAASLARSAAPGFPIYSSTWGHARELDGYISHWGAAQYGLFPVSEIRQRQQAGDKFWFTTDGQQAIDTPLLATERLLPTYCFAYDFDGYEFWGLAWWTYNPWKKGWHAFISQSDQGETFYRVRYPNGDGYVVYPGGPIGTEGFLPSIRLEAVREGAEDYEYYRLLSNLIAASPGGDNSSALAALQQARDLVSIPNAGGLHSLAIMPDPDAIYRVRAAVATEIEKRLPVEPDGGTLDGYADAEAEEDGSWPDAGDDGGGSGDTISDQEANADGPEAEADGVDELSTSSGCHCQSAEGRGGWLLALLPCLRKRKLQSLTAHQEIL